MPERILATLAVIMLATLSSVQAQTSAWVAPDGRFSVEFAANGFTPVGNDAAEEFDLIEVEHQAHQRRSGHARMCSVTQGRIPNAPPVTQAQADAVLASTPEEVTRAAMRGALSEYVMMEVDGVAVLSFRLDTGDVRQYWRLFYVARDGGVFQTAVSCGGTGSLDASDLATINETLGSLRFTEAQ